jgi:hypothetical protein
MNDPIYACGNASSAVIKLITDSRGDLVDMDYCCLDCWTGDLPDYWPAYQWPDYSVYCQTCQTPINLTNQD